MLAALMFRTAFGWPSRFPDRLLIPKHSSLGLQYNGFALEWNRQAIQGSAKSKMPAPRTSPRKRPIRRIELAPAASTQARLNDFLRAHSGLMVALFCLYAGLRLLIYCAAFPMVNNVDEPYHFAAIEMYARGQWPGKELPRPDRESAKFIALYASSEYLLSRAQIEQFHLEVPFYQSTAQRERIVAAGYQEWLNSPNFEAQSTPFYYLVGAYWYRLGRAFDLTEWQLAYWVRFLNPVVYVLLLGISYAYVRKIYPGRMFLWLGVPALLAVFPQDVFFGMNRDVLSGPMSAVALLLLMKAVDERSSGWLLAASFAVSIGFLVNVSNCVLYGALAVSLWFWVRRSTTATPMTVGIASGAGFVSVALPAAWMLRNRAVMGDLTGSRAKIEHLRWTVKPLGQMFHHPIFSLHGLSYFLTNLGASFWRGEYVWHAERMHWPVADRIYLASSALAIPAFIALVVRKWKVSSPIQRMAALQACVVVIGSVVFMAAISLPFDFHNCMYPSRANPFFLSGRIISGALLPFAMMYVSGLEYLLAPARKWAPPAAVLACLLLFITLTEFQIRSVVFSSPYNYFAIRAWQQNH